MIRVINGRVVVLRLLCAPRHLIAALGRPVLGDIPIRLQKGVRIELIGPIQRDPGYLNQEWQIATVEVESSSSARDRPFLRWKLEVRRISEQFGDCGLQSALNGVPRDVVSPGEQLSFQQYLPVAQVEFRQSLEISAIHVNDHPWS